MQISNITFRFYPVFQYQPFHRFPINSTGSEYYVVMVYYVYVAEGISLRSVGVSSSHRELLVVNCDLDPECVDSELRVALQWIAASELGLVAVYFRKPKVKRASKVGAAETQVQIQTLWSWPHIVQCTVVKIIE